MDKDIIKDNSKDPYMEFSVRKAEKIAKALYLVTNFFDVREPLKWSLRDLSLRLLGRISLLSASSLSDREKTVLDIHSIGHELMSLVMIAEASNFITHMNAEFLNREIKHLSDFIEEKHRHHYTSLRSIDLGGDFFSVPDIERSIVSRTVKDKDKEGKSPLEKTSNYGLRIKSANVSDFRQNLNLIAREHNSRRDKIILIAKNKPAFSIKDISTEMRDVSEKTIQRELLEMVREGMLHKEGERRWSRYTLIP